MLHFSFRRLRPSVTSLMWSNLMTKDRFRPVQSTWWSAYSLAGGLRLQNNA